MSGDAVMTQYEMPRAWLWLGESRSPYQGSKQTAGRKITSKYAMRRMSRNGRLPQVGKSVLADATTCQANL